MYASIRITILLVFLTASACEAEPINRQITVPGDHVPVHEQYLEKRIDTCIPLEGYAIDPCREIIEFTPSETGMSSSEMISEYAPSINDLLREVPILEVTTHIIVRATVLPETTRCEPAKLSTYYYTPADAYEMLGDDVRLLLCYTDIKVNEYLVGTGPPILTIVMGSDSYFTYQFSNRPQHEFEAFSEFIKSIVLAEIEGSEIILFLGTSHTASVEAWTRYGFWDVQRRSDGTIVAVSPSKQHYEPTPDNLARLEMPLEEFRKQIVAAHEARAAATGGRIGPAYSSGRTKRSADDPPLPPLITGANDLHSYYRNELRAYENLTATPQPPPPVPDQ